MVLYVHRQPTLDTFNMASTMHASLPLNNVILITNCPGLSPLMELLNLINKNQAVSKETFSIFLFDDSAHVPTLLYTGTADPLWRKRVKARWRMEEFNISVQSQPSTYLILLLYGREY